MSFDVVIVGGSFAGLAAAMPLARACRRVLLIDAKRPRNRFASASHGFLGQDGKSPEAIRTLFLAELSAYPNLQVVEGEVVRAHKEASGFVLTLSSGSEQRGRRLVLATGVEDELPDVPGLRERWGRSVLHCPYCHGYEVRGRPLGVLGVLSKSSHQALLLPDWGPTTYFSHDAPCDEEQRAQLTRRGVTIESARVVELLGKAPELEAVRLADGRVVPLQALFTASKTRVVSGLAEQLGCAFDEGFTGPYLRVDEWKQTSVPGVYAAGDAATQMHNATLAAAAGTMAGVAAHQSLVMESA